MSRRTKPSYAVKVVDLDDVFLKAKAHVSDFFNKINTQETYSSSGAHYLLLRGSTLAVDFYRLIRQYFGSEGTQEADNYAAAILYDLAFAIAKSDAQVFFKTLHLTDPLERLATGPHMFAHTGWATVELLDGQVSADDDFRLIYNHNDSFEAVSWLRGNESAPFPICSMNAGYSAGWCSESLGISLVSKEISCKACGDSTCTFLMAPPHRLKEYMQSYLDEHSLVYPYCSSEAGDFSSLRETSATSNFGGIHGAVIQRVMRYARELDLTKQTLQTKIEALEAEVCKRQKAEQKLKQLVNYDHLTGLYNRTSFNKTISVLVNESTEKHALIYIDLDDFKAINDSLGHDAGDEVLIATAIALNDVIQEGDTVARLGGDEFGVIISNYHDCSEVDSIIESMLDKLSSIIVGGYQFSMTASVGVACFPADAKSVTELQRKADMVMYKAKKLGKNRFCYYNSTLDKQLQRNLLLSKALCEAIQSGGLSLVLQPKVSFEDGSVVGLEAFARWHHLTLGDIFPLEFTQIAENYGYSHKLCALLLQKVGQALSQLQQQKFSGRVSINLSSLQFYNQNLLSAIDSMLEKFNLKPACLALDITEKALMRDEKRAQQLLTQLQQRNISLCVDNFGTGLSALSTLCDFPLDAVKLDRRFIVDIQSNSRKKQMSQSIIDMAHVQGLSVVAEGVELAAQAKVLRENGCDQMQGYLVCHPMPVDEVLTLLATLDGRPLYSQVH